MNSKEIKKLLIEDYQKMTFEEKVATLEKYGIEVSETDIKNHEVSKQIVTITAKNNPNVEKTFLSSKVASGQISGPWKPTKMQAVYGISRISVENKKNNSVQKISNCVTRKKSSPTLAKKVLYNQNG